MRKRATLALLGVAAVTGSLLVPVAATAQEPPSEPALDWSNYDKITLSRDTGEPIGMAVMDDGRVLHTARDGVVRLTDPVEGTTEVAAELEVYRNSEDGLQGIALDPNFAENNWVYLYYAPLGDTPPGSAPLTLPEGEDDTYWDQWLGVNRLSRFQWDAATDTIDLTSEEVIIEVEVQRGQCCHVGGDIDFDSQGNLYLSTGDNTPASGPNTDGYAPINDAAGYNPGLDARRSAGNANDLRGAILRITPQDGGGYTIPEGNLFAPGTAGTRPEIFVMGLRNPFRMAVDPATDTVVWADYGPDAGTADPERGPMGYVEWQSTRDPINAGWPFCHGPNAEYRRYDFATGESGEAYDCTAPVNDSRWNTGITELPAATAPQLYYGDNPGDQPRDELVEFSPRGGQGPMGGPVYRRPAEAPDTAWPAFWDGQAFFYEYSQDYVAAFAFPGGDPAGEVGEITNVLPNDALFANAQPQWSGPIDVEFGPDGSMYVLDYGKGFFRQNPTAALYRIDYAPGNKTPNASISGGPTGGQPPLEVSLSAEGSYDPDGDALSYAWDLGSGEFTETGESVTAQFDEVGVVTVRLRVTDEHGKAHVTSQQITVGNTPPDVTITRPFEGSFFSWGDRVPWVADVADAEDESIDCSWRGRGSWFFAIGHDSHSHGVDSGSGCSGTLATPADGGHGATEHVFGVLGVTYRDQGAGELPEATGGDSQVWNLKELQAEHAHVREGVDVVDDAEASGTRYVAGFTADDTLGYHPVNLVGIDGVELVARAAAGATVSLRWDDPSAEPFTTFEVEEGDAWQTLSTTFGDRPTGTGTLYVTTSAAVDLDTLTFEGDGALAVVEATLEPESSDGDAGWYRSDVTASFASPYGAELTSVEVSTDGGESWTELVEAGETGTVTLDAEGEHTLTYRATEGSGEPSTPRERVVRIDATAPELTLTGIQDGATYATDDEVVPVFEAADATSGLASLVGAVDGRPVESGQPLALDRLSLGTHRLVVTATDVAGNETTATVTFTVEASTDGEQPGPPEHVVCPQDRPGFPDVGPESPHARNVGCAAALELVRGKRDGRFDPSGSLTRGQLASIISRVATAIGRPLEGSASFPDLDPDDVHADAIARVAASGYLQGFADGTVRSQRPVTRGQFASIVVRFVEDVTGSELPALDGFPDAGPPHETAVSKAATAGLLEGRADGRVHPNRDVRRDQAASILVRMLDLLPVVEE